MTTPALAPAPAASRRMDLGRLAMVPLMAVLLSLNALAVWRAVTDGASSPMHLVGTALSVAFYALVIDCYFRRSRAKATSTSMSSHLAAVTASWLPFAFPVAGLYASSDGFPAAGSALLVAGMAWSVWSLRTLGKSFSVLAQARKVVRSGPYAVVRHPLYLGELVAMLGIVLLTPSMLTVGLWVALVALQVHRMGHEEAVLESHLDDYADYRLHTKRLVPAVY